MRYAALMALGTLAMFAAASTLASVCVAFVWPMIRHPLARRRSVSRARALFLLRSIPTTTGAVACAVTAWAFLRHEPSATNEVPGWVLITSAAAGAALLLSGAYRVVSTCWTTNRFVRALEATARRISVAGGPLPTCQVDMAFPLVALAGFWRFRLLVARNVISEMPADELAVVLNHELAHARHRDNVIRLLMTALPDVLRLADRRLGIERAWREAAEDAADDVAADGDPKARACLASALIRVAKMAGDRGDARVPLLAFHDGQSIERRVRRLIGVAEPHASLPWQMRAAAVLVPLAAAAAVLIQWDATLLTVHELIEWIVTRP